MADQPVEDPAAVPQTGASPAGHATALSGTGDGGAAGPDAVSAVPLPDRRARVRRRLRRRIAEPSDVDVIRARLDAEQRRS